MRGSDTMIMWVLTQEPTEQIARAIELVEAKLGTEDEIDWLVAIDPPAVALEGDATPLG